jgi:hypothetical protein
MKVFLSIAVGIFAGVYLCASDFIHFPAQNTKDDVITRNEVSGLFHDLYFKSIRKADYTYYVTFSEQMEDLKLPEKCYADGASNDMEGCALVGRPLQKKEIPDIDLSKEYKINAQAKVLLISYDNKLPDPVVGVGGSIHAIYPDLFYGLLNGTEKPSIQYYGGILEDPTLWGFDVTMINGEIMLMEQVYQQ